MRWLFRWFFLRFAVKNVLNYFSQRINRIQRISCINFVAVNLLEQQSTDTVSIHSNNIVQSI